jgi:hypothetical protein
VQLTNLATVLTRAGLHVVEVEGWKTRGHGPMTDVLGVTCHHTAPGVRSLRPRLSLPVIKDGRPGLDGPLAQLYLDRDGTWYTVAAGLCYHAGVSRSPSYTNSHRIGVEAEAAGDGWLEDWPVVQMNSYGIGCAALADAFGFPVTEVLGHKETCAPVGRKSDPSFAMTKFRGRVARELNDLHAPKDQEEDDMQLTDKIELSVAAARHLNAVNPSKDFAEGDEVSVAYCLLWGSVGAQEAAAASEALAATVTEQGQQIAALTQLVAKLTPTVG